METFEKCLLKYRTRLRQILAGAGVASNPGVEDDWILDRIAELIPGPPPLTIENIPASLLKLVGKKYQWEPELARQKIARTQEILMLKAVNDAITFLAYQIIPGTTLTLCDGCNVRQSFEHRCHGDKSVVSGKQTGKSCQCADCFVLKYLFLT